MRLQFGKKGAPLIRRVSLVVWCGRCYCPAMAATQLRTFVAMTLVLLLAVGGVGNCVRGLETAAVAAETSMPMSDGCDGCRDDAAAPHLCPTFCFSATILPQIANAAYIALVSQILPEARPLRLADAHGPPDLHPPKFTGLG
ncbi:hypothetical protein [Pseudorhodoplanes sinuspersici]|uniref:Uncharacterized protein n=1 Tax=Pseudorhodoplanes sinuspersici TaxID=1235591 RepID=A0A1W6ZML5_9HYPH|nr:hypothetical protein [Pseudorhodoplanes sinuspersici]ARP98370.1 hypothetical protein CAK95_04160 [Pseudorhodoplanes sinuspersici]RKE66035.1 hypothetical protein DFP91_5610 [Pseudorhodoplanes sinuspersici]